MHESLQQLNFLHLYYFWVVARDGSIAAACRNLHLAQPTVSMQIRRLEKTIGHPLFDRVGRKLVLTDVGQTVFSYAEDIFAKGRELMGALRGAPSNGRATQLLVGMPMVMPKLISYRLIEPVFHMTHPIKVVCHEAPLEELVDDLRHHRRDVILSDKPIAPTSHVRCYSHLLGESTVSFCATGALAARYRHNFPKSLHEAPMLLPEPVTEMRRQLDRWFDAEEISPRIVGEFNDSALLKEFGQAGVGVFPVTSAVVAQVKRQYNVELLGHLPAVRLKFYAITAERKLTHPAVVVISENARKGLLNYRD
jgi:LysR family transcriptional activator of nhaA